MPAKARPRATPGSRRKAAAKASGRVSAATKRAVRTRRGSTSPRGGAHAPRTKASPVQSARSRRRAPARSGGRDFKPPDPERVAHVLELLQRAHPGARIALEFETPLQLLIATILSAQCTDKRVNMVTPGLFKRYPDAAAFAAVPQEQLEREIRSTGFFRNKARAIRECCADIVSKHGGQVPRTIEQLIALRGVGRKTANVVLGNAFGIPGIVVDTHVSRLSHRLGFTRESDPVKIEFALMPLIPKDRWTIFSHWLILHGRTICIARKPRCSICPLAVHCPRLGVTSPA